MKTINKNMNKAMNIVNNTVNIAAYEEAVKCITSFSKSEEMLIVSILLHTIQDKDAELEEKETEMTYIPKKGWVKQTKKPYSKKNILKDKAKAGYHNGAKKEGCGNWDKFGKPEKLMADVKRDVKSQMDEVNDPTTDTNSITDMVTMMLTYIDLDIYTTGMKQVWYHYNHEFAHLTRWAVLVDEYKVEMEQNIHNLTLDLYQMVDECYPEVPYADRNEAVMEVKEVLEDELASTLKSMMDYCVRRWKEVNFPEF